MWDDFVNEPPRAKKALTSLSKEEDEDDDGNSGGDDDNNEQKVCPLTCFPDLGSMGLEVLIWGKNFGISHF